MSGKDDAPEIVVEKDVAVPMSDGVVLRANVFRPAGTTSRKRNSWRRYSRSIIPGSVLRGWSCRFFPESATGYAGKGRVRVK